MTAAMEAGLVGRKKPMLAKRIGVSEPERLLRLPPRPLHAAARAVREEMTVREERTENRRSSEPGVERRGQGAGVC
jgi:hypothetical protein